LADDKLQLDLAQEPIHDQGQTPTAGDKSAPPNTALPSGADGTDGEPNGNGCAPGLGSVSRKAWVDSFLSRFLHETGVKATRTQIWRAAGHGKARQFQFWQASSPKASKQDDLTFPRILAMKPIEFETLLKKRGII
jgi:hypothetical protein